MSSFSLLSFILIFSLLPLLSSARPCRPLFISYYTITTTTTTSTEATTAGDPQLAASSSRFFAVYRIFPRPNRPAHLGGPHLQHRQIADRIGVTSSSFQDRAKDILTVVASLLFGVACGAITAATMYLLWSMLPTHQEIDESEGEKNPKKMGYVKIASAPVVTATATKEGYEGK